MVRAPAHPKEKGADLAELTTVYFKTPEGIAKAIIGKDQIPFFEKLGAVRQPGQVDEKKDLPEPLENQEQEQSETAGDISDETNQLNPDHGSGRPGSLRFHKLSIMELQTLDEINAYLSNVTGKGIDARIKRPDRAQRYAIKTIKEWLKNECQNT